MNHSLVFAMQFAAYSTEIDQKNCHCYNHCQKVGGTQQKIIMNVHRLPFIELLNWFSSDFRFKSLCMTMKVRLYGKQQESQ